MRIITFLLLSTLPLLFGCTNFLYYPTRSIYYDYRKLSPPPEEHKFVSNKIEIRGWIFRVNKPKGTFIFFHGNGQNRSAHFLSVYWLVLEGYNLAIFDYPGYGQTKGKPTPESTVTTAIDTVRYVQSQVPERPLIIYGHSLGGAIASRATFSIQDDVQPELLIVDSSFLSYQRAAQKVMAKSVLTWPLQPLAYVLLNDQWAPEKIIKDLKVKTLVIHSRKDEVVPFVLGEDLFAQLSEPKDFWIKERNSHNEIFATQEEKVEFLKRIHRLLNREGPDKNK